MTIHVGSLQERNGAKGKYWIIPGDGGKDYMTDDPAITNYLGKDVEVTMKPGNKVNFIKLVGPVQGASTTPTPSTPASPPYEGLTPGRDPGAEAAIRIRIAAMDSASRLVAAMIDKDAFKPSLANAKAVTFDIYRFLHETMISCEKGEAMLKGDGEAI